MKDFEINIHVNLGVASEVRQWVSALLCRQVESKSFGNETMTDNWRKEGIEVTAEPAKTAEPVKAAEPKKEEPAKAAPAKKKKGPAAEEIRAIMDATRKRIEGEDYKENSQSELHKKYHRELNTKFRLIAAVLHKDADSASTDDKPSSLPDDKVEAFRTQCDGIVIGSDGKLVTSIPF